MKNQKPATDLSIAKWTTFLLVLTAVMAWAVRGVVLRAGRMKAADTAASAFSRMSAGTQASVVVRLDQVAGADLKGSVLERETNTVYRRPEAGRSVVSAILMPETSVVMGKAEDIVPGAIVQLDGTLDNQHVVRTSEVVILTGYVRLSEGAR